MLVTWLRAQLDDDERVAREATPGPWQALEDAEGDGCSIAPGVVWPGYDVRSGVDRPADAEHIARHDPARVLAEVDAKRRILDIHGTGADPCDAHDASLRSIPCDTLLLLALPFADRPGYLDEWKP